MKQVAIRPDFIKLGQLLKLLGYVTTGGQEKAFLESHKILVNNEPENRRGRKIKIGDRVVVDNTPFQVVTLEN